ncbi:head GIN domain-containing protein [Pedobacter nototheniae]|uniref:head GIN domain-containing protein n=1 Tax=Pedobacter nototheniae TaxID=2488994 RepID=UPI0029301085|nr:head GIN domain-containing protein [Pedobacter nototheniae]
MKKIFTIACTVLMLSAGLNSVIASPVKNKTTKISGDERDVKNFNGIAAGGPITVIVKLGNTESLRFEGDADAISTLVTEVKSSVLIIRPETSWKSWSRKYEGKKIIAYVTAKKISSLTMSGDGSISVDGTLSTSELATTISGSGKVTVNTNAQKITSVVSGSGILNISGKTEEGSVTISGSGAFNGKNLTVQNFSTRISGSGSVNIHAENKIDAVISGSGSVNYSGNAEVEKTIVGSGRVRKI